MSASPIVQITLQGLKTTVQAAVSDQVLQFSQAAAVAVEKAVQEYDFEKEIGETINESLESLKWEVANVIRDEFRKEVRAKLEEALRARMPEVDKLLKGLAEDSLASFVDRIKLGQM